MTDTFKECNGVQDEFFKVVYSGVQFMKRYSFIRSYFADSDFDGSEDPYENNANTCFLQNQEYKVQDSANSNACSSSIFPISSSASCTPEDLSII